MRASRRMAASPCRASILRDGRPRGRPPQDEVVNCVEHSILARPAMASFIQLVVSGLATGAIYALVAVGFTLLWQTSQTINFAQGEFVMLPAFLMLGAMHAGAPFWLAVLIGAILSLILLGLGFKLLLVDPMLRHGVLPLAIATMALAIGIKEAVKQFFSAEASPFPSIVPAGDVSILGRVVSLQSLGVLALAIAAVVGLTALLNRTSIGHQMQAT